MSHSTKRTCVWGSVFGLAVAFVCLCGAHVYRTNSLFGLSVPSLVLGLLAFCLLAFAVAVAAALIFAALPRISEAGGSFPLSPRAVFLIVWLGLFLIWMLCLRSYWPGVLTYDIPTQTDFVFSGKWTTQQPPLHTLIWAIFLKMEGLGGLHAITWYAIFQMLCLAAACAYLPAFMVARKAKTWFVGIVLAFLFLNPVLALFSIAPTKDVLLTACMIPLMLELVRMTTGPEAFFAQPKRVILLAVWLVLSCLLRSNIVVVAVLFAVLACIIMRSRFKQIALLFGASILLVSMITGPGYRALDISPGSSAMVSVPVQQVAHVVVYHEQELSAEELAVVEAVLPVDQVVKDYNPRFADKVVRLFKGRDTGLAAMKDKVIDAGKLWATWIVRYPADYIDAFVSLNVPYWYPFAETPDPYSARPYIETARWKESPNYSVELPSEDAPLHGFYERVADYSAFAGTPLAAVFSPAMPFMYLLLATCALAAQRGGKGRVLAISFLLFFWLSFVFGPVSNMRYMLPLFAMFPLLWASVLQPQAVFGNGAENGQHGHDDSESAAERGRARA